ncbi:MAG: hypothetical protein DCC57_12435 [Chloroflexi bacterium]|nr:MAG: hypothetical protein DCC57_12435 [Chloroflexota bacterium]
MVGAGDILIGRHQVIEVDDLRPHAHVDPQPGQPRVGSPRPRCGQRRRRERGRRRRRGPWQRLRGGGLHRRGRGRGRGRRHRHAARRQQHDQQQDFYFPHRFNFHKGFNAR